MITIGELENRTNELIEQFENDNEHNVFEIMGQTGSGKSTFLTSIEKKYETENKRVDCLGRMGPMQLKNYELDGLIDYIISGKTDLMLIDELLLDLPARRDFYRKIAAYSRNCKVIIARQARGEMTLLPLNIGEN